MPDLPDVSAHGTRPRHDRPWLATGLVAIALTVVSMVLAAAGAPEEIVLAPAVLAFVCLLGVAVMVVIGVRRVSRLNGRAARLNELVFEIATLRQMADPEAIAADPVLAGRIDAHAHAAMLAMEAHGDEQEAVIRELEHVSAALVDLIAKRTEADSDESRSRRVPPGRR